MERLKAVQDDASDWRIRLAAVRGVHERDARAHIPMLASTGIHEGTLPALKSIRCFPVPGYNLPMRWGKSVLMVWGLAAAAFCGDQPSNLPLLPCPEGTPGAVSCNPSKKELKEATEAFTKGLRLQKEKRLDQAFDQFETAARLAPKDVDYVTAREMTRQQIVFDHLQRGNAEMLKGRQIEALAEFRTALHLDPQNEFAQQRLRDAMARMGAANRRPRRRFWPTPERSG